MMRFTGVALLFATSLAMAGCNSGLSDGGAACRNAGGECYQGAVSSLCVQRGPDGCDYIPPSPNGPFCCIVFTDAGAPVPADAGGGG